MKRILCLFFVVQSWAVNAQNCDCRTNLDSLIQKISTDYAGYRDKVSNSKNRLAYARMVTQLRIQSMRSPSRAECFDILAAYINHFQDKHLQIGVYNKEHALKLFDPLTETQARQLTQKAASSSPEGIWWHDEKKLKIAIVKDGKAADTYKGIVLESADTTYKTGQLFSKIKKNGTFYSVHEFGSYLLSLDPRAKFQGNLFYNYFPWKRLFPTTTTPAEEKELATWQNGNKGLACWKPSPNVVCVRIPTFGMQWSQFETFIKKNDSLIRATPYLIIDVRNNGGGNFGMELLLPYLYTKPFIVKGGLMQASINNNRVFSSDYSSDSTLLRKLRQNIGAYVPQPDFPVSYEAALPNPKKVVILQNALCGSATEYSIQVVKDFEKVTTMGENTMGMMDYGDLRQPTPIPCPDFTFVIPIVKSSWTDTAPIDQTGIAPKIQLKSPESDWLSEAVKYLENQK